MADFLDETWLVLTDENGQPLLDDLQAIPASLAGQSLDTVFAAADALSQVAGAFTTGTDANLALRRTMTLLQSALVPATSAAYVALAAANLSTPAGLLTAVAAAGNAAAGHASLVDLANLNTVLSRA